MRMEESRPIVDIVGICGWPGKCYYGKNYCCILRILCSIWAWIRFYMGLVVLAVVDGIFS